MIKPLISIALCTFNGEEFLEEQLESLVNQTYQNLEIIIIDDLSTDRTLQILKGYANKFATIKLFQNEVNLGYIKNFEKAISLCTGEFIALADQDDIWELHKIDLMFNHIGKSYLIYHDSAFIDSHGKLMGKNLSDIVNFYDGDSPNAFLFFNCVSSHALLFNKRLKNYLFPFPHSNLHDAWIAYVALNMGSITYIKDCLVKYRNHSKNTTDILKQRKNIITKKEKLNKELNWLICCRDLSIQKDPDFVSDLVELFKKPRNQPFSLPIFSLLIKNYFQLFPIYKRSFFSKLNFIIKKSLNLKNEKASKY